MNQHFEYKNLNSFEAIRTAKFLLRHSITVQEQLLSKSFVDLRKNLMGSLKQSAWKFGIKIVTYILINRIKTRKSNES
ncbi:MAG: hypothetical protein ACNA7V_07415 [Bacteroidales bacterium]